MKKHSVNSAEKEMGGFVLVCHFGMMLFGITAWLTGDAADDHKKYEHFWFTMHSWIGMGLVSSLSLYIVYCTFGPRESRFSNWVPCTKREAFDDPAGYSGSFKVQATGTHKPSGPCRAAPDLRSTRVCGNGSDRIVNVFPS